MIAARKQIERTSDTDLSPKCCGLATRILGGRRRMIPAALILLLAMATPSLAQMGGIVTTGTVSFGNTPHTYAVVIDSSTPAGYYVRVWLDGDRVMQLWPGQIQGQTMEMNYHIYRTMGQHWTLRGGMDQTAYWRAESAGVMQLDGNTIPANTMGIVTGPISGWGRRTYRAHIGANVQWYPVTDNWWSVVFNPTNVNWPLFRQWQAAMQPRPTPPQPGPPKKGLKNVTVNQHQVIVKMWDHALQDGDIVDLYLDGQYLRRINLTNNGTSITLNLTQGQHRFLVRALNEGTDEPNTASIHVSGVVRDEPQQSWSMKTGQQTEMGITVQP